MWSLLSISLALSCIAVLDLVRRQYLQHTKPGYPLPPGPQGLPAIGNVTAFTSGAPWVTFAKWAKTYGDLMYFRFLGQDFIIINSEAIAKDLFEIRSKNYSDRPHLITRQLCGRDFSSAFMEYGDTWRLHRRFFHQTFRREAVDRFTPLQHRKVCQLLRRLLDNPGQFREHIFEYTGSLILGTVYDYDAKSRKDELFDIIFQTLDVIGIALRTDVSLFINAFPALLKLPSWLPGMSFKGDMAVAKELSKLYVQKPFEYSLQRLSTGNCAPSMMSDALLTVEENGTVASAEWTKNASWMKDLSHAAATSSLAGAETSDSVISLFFLLMAENPEIQKKAQAQIDSIVGGLHRLPLIEDRPMLPYVDAIFRETLRYCPVVPLAIPHAVVDEDIYAGYRIPKGAVIVSNLWSMSRDGVKYPRADKFIPERFLNEDGSLKPDDLENIIFGFGRRICVGRYFADMSVWSVIVKILAVFWIEKTRDENGTEIPIEEKYPNSVVVHPLPFKCSIVPRIPGMDADQMEQLIEESTT